jgi:AraC-like DNA-binding protein
MTFGQRDGTGNPCGSSTVKAGARAAHGDKRSVDFDELVRHQRYAKVYSDHSRCGSWQFGICRTRIQPQAINNIPAGYAALFFMGQPTRITIEVMGKRHPTRDYAPGEVLVRPKGLDWASRFHRSSAGSKLALPTETVRSVLGDPDADFDDAIASFQLRPFWSPLLAELMRKLDYAVFEMADASPLLLDTLYHAVCWEVWRLSGAGQSKRSSAREPRLSDQDLRLVNQYVDETNACRVDFAALGRLLDLPRSQVAAAFKHTLGQTPYQYILARRIRRARCLIEASDVPLSEIAHRCGFSSQAHLTDTVARKVGATPRTLRQASRA